MFFLLVGIAGLLLKYLEISPVAELSWWMVLAPFGLAVAWWSWADASGYTKRKAIEKMDERTKKRLEKQRDALGMIKKRK
ncbi:MAG: TIGR04438 family Trp-rich protein [Pseudomonadota bacterium]|nr:TIGR04438 family Trp-rich protein [Pseudomonadota bacterium]